MVEFKHDQKGRCTIYARFSPRPDAATSESCEYQVVRCEEYAKQKGWRVSGVYKDPDRSGSDEFREVLWSAIDGIGKGDVLLVLNRDRLARNVYLAETINRAVNRKGGRICAVIGDVDGEGPEATLVRQISAAISEYERKSMAIRTRISMLAYQKQGKRMGGKVPYGLAVDPSDDTRLVENVIEKGEIEKVMKLRQTGMTFSEIASALDPSAARSGKWHAEQVRRIVMRFERDVMQ